MQAVEFLELDKGSCVAEEVVDDRVVGEGGVVEGIAAFGVGLQLLVLDEVHPGNADLQAVAALCPGEIVAGLEVFGSVLPRKVAGVPVGADRCSKVDFGEPVERVVSCKKRGGGETGGGRIGSGGGDREFCSRCN